MPTLGFSVRGRVQGVGFRYFVLRLARECGVGGWVRNEPDGSVAAVASGDDGALARFAAGLEMGPPAARVESVTSRTLPQQHFAGFDLR